MVGREGGREGGLVGWLVGWLVVGRVGWLVGAFVCWLVGGREGGKVLRKDCSMFVLFVVEVTCVCACTIWGGWVYIMRGSSVSDLCCGG